MYDFDFKHSKLIKNEKNAADFGNYSFLVIASKLQKINNKRQLNKTLQPVWHK